MGDAANVKPRMILFGSAAMIDGEGRLITLPEKTFLLSLLICLSGPTYEVNRLVAARFLWPDQENAAANLRQLLRRIRLLQTERDIEFIRVNENNVGIIPNSIEIDILQFQKENQNIDWSNIIGFINLYAGDLVPDIDIPDGDARIWLEFQRTAFRNSFIAGITGLLTRSDAELYNGLVREIAQKLLEVDSGQEIAYRALMSSFARTGELNRVYSTFEQCKAVLKREFNILPSTETVALYTELTRGSRQGFGDNNLVGAVNDVASVAAGLPKLAILMPGGAKTAAANIATALLDDVIINLCALRTIRVVAPHTSWSLSSKQLSDAELNSFGINYVAQTNLVSLAGQVRLNVKLFGLSDHTIVWADSLTLSIETSATSFHKLSRGLALSLIDAVEKSELARFDQRHDAGAYFWHLVGQRHLRNLNLPDVRRAKKAFRQSINADPKFAASHAGFARAVHREWLLLGRGDAELLDVAADTAHRAVMLDQRDARGYRELGLCMLYRRQWDESVAHFDEAEARNPYYADLLADFADALGHAGRPQDGLVRIRQAIELNPVPPEKYWWDLAGLYFKLQCYQEAIDAIGRMDHATPGLRIVAASWAHLGELEKARACVSEFMEAYPNFDVSAWLDIVPNRDLDHTRHYEAGLRLAGFQ